MPTTVRTHGRTFDTTSSAGSAAAADWYQEHTDDEAGAKTLEAAHLWTVPRTDLREVCLRHDNGRYRRVPWEDLREMASRPDASGDLYHGLLADTHAELHRLWGNRPAYHTAFQSGLMYDDARRQLDANQAVLDAHDTPERYARDYGAAVDPHG